MSTWPVNTKPKVVVSDIHHRVSGVSTTCRAVTPLLAEQFDLVYHGHHALTGVARVRSYWALIKQLKQSPKIIWHARRNNEMQRALFAKHVLRLPIKIVFTSAAIRRHSWWPRQLIKRMDYIIATSQQAAELVDAQQVVPHGVAIDHFRPGALSVDPERIVFAISGRVRPEKGTDLLVSALRPLLLANPGFELRIAGSVTKKYRAFADRLAHQLRDVAKQVHWLGEVAPQDMPAFYQGADIVCAPARYEGFGMVPIEAMACGSAVVASRTGAYPDMIDDSVGALVAVGDAQALREALEQLVKHPERLVACKQTALTHVHRYRLEYEAQGIAKAYQAVQESDE